MKKNKCLDVLAPKPVHPRAVRVHGLFGIPFVRQHMVVDRRWKPSSLTEQFKGMTDLLAKRLISAKLGIQAEHKRTLKQFRTLRNQCRNGRQKLQMTLYGSNTKSIRSYLINHKDLQRLYQRMPIHMVVDNINQRTFVMRKERDRLRYRLNQLKKKYKNKLIEHATLENRLKYENEFILDDEKKCWELRKKIENSNVRLKAIRTINGTYKKMIQILRYDSIFYEPILRSLDSDIEDQAQFIKHILWMGMPAIAKFKELSEEYRVFEERARKDMQSKLQLLATFKRAEVRRPSQIALRPKTEGIINLSKRYVRETDSMMMLKHELENIENTIKRVKMTTLCSQAKEVFPRIKSQVENNKKLMKSIEKNNLGHETLEIKMKRAQVLKDVLINNLSDEEKERLEKISYLENRIKEEDEYEASTLAHMKLRADAYVLLRFTLWNFNEILRHVNRGRRVPRLEYPDSYLRLPLLKFEMMNMRSVPPEAYEENIDEIMLTVKKKVQALMRAVKQEISPDVMKKYINDYHQEYVNTIELDELPEEQPAPEVDDDILDTRTMQNIPNRKQLKAQSAKIVEELAKKED